MDKYLILAVHVSDRAKKAGDVQNILTEYGCYIQTRVGLHNVHSDLCSERGVIIVHVHKSEEIFKEISKKLQSIEGIEVKEIIF